MGRKSSNTMRVIHRYLGFFLAGIMAVYSISGIVLIFRDSDFLKQANVYYKQLDANLDANQIGKAIKMKNLKVERTEGELLVFKNGSYNTQSGEVEWVKNELPLILSKMTHLHKAKSSQPLFFLNIFFGLSLLFFVISSFWMFMPSTSVFKKGIYFTAGGILLTLLLLFV